MPTFADHDFIAGDRVAPIRARITGAALRLLHGGTPIGDPIELVEANRALVEAAVQRQISRRIPHDGIVVLGERDLTVAD
jgi:hypothetical protein